MRDAKGQHLRDWEEELEMSPLSFFSLKAMFDWEWGWGGDWRYGSVDKMLAMQAWNPEFWSTVLMEKLCPTGIPGEMGEPRVSWLTRLVGSYPPPGSLRDSVSKINWKILRKTLESISGLHIDTHMHVHMWVPMHTTSHTCILARRKQLI